MPQSAAAGGSRSLATLLKTMWALFASSELLLAPAASQSACSSFGGDMYVPSGTTAQVQLLTFPDSTDSLCTGQVVATKLQAGQEVRLQTAIRSFQCCALGQTIVVTDDTVAPYTVSGSVCTSFVGDTANTPIKLVCEATTEVPITCVRACFSYRPVTGKPCGRYRP